MIRIGFPLKGSLKGSCPSCESVKGSIRVYSKGSIIYRGLPWQPHGDFAPYTYNVTPSVQ